jgi:hypothetical protein
MEVPQRLNKFIQGSVNMPYRHP